MLKLAGSGLPLPLGAIANARTMTSIWNLIDLIQLATEKHQVGGTLALAGDATSVSTPEMFRLLARSLGRKSRIVPVPMWVLMLAGRVTGKSSEIERLTGSLEVEAGSGAEGWGWRPPMTTEEGLSRTAKWFGETQAAGGEVQ
jgi:nucleoside-diphosphate-sugar epimerase